MIQMQLLQVMVGVMMLTLGRRLFWLFVGVLGFMFAFQTAQQYFGGQPVWIAWVAALLCGVAGALLAVFFQALAVILGGFAAGSTISAHLAVLLGFEPAPAIVLLGGAAGAVLLYVLFDWALIGLSSAAGAALAVHALNLKPGAGMLLFAVLVAAGILIQAAWFRRSGNAAQ